MVRTVAASSLHQPNPHLLSPPVHFAMEAIRPLLLPLLGMMVMAKLSLLARERGLPRDADSRVRRRLAGIMATALSLTILMHWIAFRLFHVLLPQERTALYIAVLSIGITGLIAAEPLRTRLGHTVQRVLAASMVVAALYFLSCLRLTYFKEWAWNADTHRAYPVLAYYNHKYGWRHVASSWHYSAVLNAYRVMSGRETLAEVKSGPPYSADSNLFVLMYSFDKEFIDQNRLKVVYRGESTEMVVAIRPDVGE